MKKSVLLGPSARSALSVLFVVAALAPLVGCAGKPGKTFVQFTYAATCVDSHGATQNVAGILTNLGGFPAGAVANTEYEVSPARYTGTCVLYWNEQVLTDDYDPPAGQPGSALNPAPHYHVHFNTGMYSWAPTAQVAIDYYLNNLFNTNSNSVTYDVVPNTGARTPSPRERTPISS